MSHPANRPVRRNREKDYNEVGHYAVGTASLIPTSMLGKFSSSQWEGSAQKPMLYYAVGGQVEEHDMGAGHRRSMEELRKMDYANYLKR